jgi:hypothetical protein
MIRVKNVLTFSNVVAFIALFVAMGGSVYAAGKLSGTQITAGSLPGNRVKAKSLTAKQIKPKSLTGAQVKPNSLGATQINEETLTGVSASSIGLVQYVTSTVTIASPLPNGTPGTASCPPGTYVIGGGATVNNEALGYVNDSGPSSTHTAWTATAYGENGIAMTVTAICTAVKSVG